MPPRSGGNYPESAGLDLGDVLRCVTVGTTRRDFRGCLAASDNGGTVEFFRDSLRQTAAGDVS